MQGRQTLLPRLRVRLEVFDVVFSDKHVNLQNSREAVEGEVAVAQAKQHCLGLGLTRVFQRLRSFLGVVRKFKLVD